MLVLGIFYLGGVLEGRRVASQTPHLLVSSGQPSDLDSRIPTDPKEHIGPPQASTVPVEQLTWLVPAPPFVPRHRNGRRRPVGH